jgi:hypothetical protein
MPTAHWQITTFLRSIKIKRKCIIAQPDLHTESILIGVLARQNTIGIVFSYQIDK